MMLTGICYKTMITSSYIRTYAKKGNDERERNSRFPWNLVNFVLEFRSLPATLNAGGGRVLREVGETSFFLKRLVEVYRLYLAVSKSLLLLTIFT